MSMLNKGYIVHEVKRLPDGFKRRCAWCLTNNDGRFAIRSHEAIQPLNIEFEIVCEGCLEREQQAVLWLVGSV